MPAPTKLTPAQEMEVVKLLRTTGLSNYEIAGQFGVSDATVRKISKKHHVERDLQPVIAKQVKRALIATAAPATATEQQMVDQAVETGVEVVKSHQSVAHGMRTVLSSLVTELADATAQQETLLGLCQQRCEADPDSANRVRQAFDRALSLNGRANTLNSLSIALERLVNVERKAHALDADAPAEDPYKDISDEQLRARIADLSRTQ